MEEHTAPRFEIPINQPILRYPHNEHCQLRSLDRSFKAKDQDVEHLMQICNEPLIYNMLFKQKQNGNPYTRADAERFFLWSRDGWNRKEWFVFLIRDAGKNIIGALDIKSNNLERAEIGYWASVAAPGIMTNAVSELCELAKHAGYLSLFALILPDNKKSFGVLARNSFIEDSAQQRNGVHYLQFSRTL